MILARRPPLVVAAFALCALAVNSVLIQTIAADNFALKQGVRVVVLALVVLALFAQRLHPPLDDGPVAAVGLPAHRTTEP